LVLLKSSPQTFELLGAEARASLLAFAAKVREEPKLDLLVNNAGR
jgi:NAD(P)-dependent dehydrogenase (short-subunit alcohol dehydrogenase family)